VGHGIRRPVPNPGEETKPVVNVPEALEEPALIVRVLAADEIGARRLAGLLAAARISTANSGYDLIVHSGDDGLLEAVREADAADVPLIAVLHGTSTRDVRSALAAGAAGVVGEDGVERCLASAVAAVAARQVVLPAAAARAFARPALSTREKQVLGLVVIGFSNADIASKLHLAETTVKSHLTSSFRKLGVRTRSEATMRILDPQTGLGLGILALTHAGADDEPET
jgi:DNA-binding NarL/FixJ family response regulator